MTTPQMPPRGGDQNNGPALLAIAAISCALAVLTTIIRLTGRTFIVRSVGWDDYTIGAATVRQCGYFSLSLNM